MFTLSTSQPTRQPARGVRRPHETTEGVNLNSQCPNSFNTIKAAMAAGLGSSLFLFQGLSSISPRILTEASLALPTFPPSPIDQQEQEKQDSNMGLSKSKPSRESRFSFRAPRQPTTSPTSPASASKRTKPEYKLKIVCSNCKRIGKSEDACRVANDINANGGTNLAFQDGSSYYENHELKPWRLEIDCCGFSRARDIGTTMVEKAMKDAGEKRRPISVDELLVRLEEGGVRYGSNVAKRVYQPRGQEAQRQQAPPAQPQSQPPVRNSYRVQHHHQQQQQQQQKQVRNSYPVQQQQHQQPQTQPQQGTRQGWSHRAGIKGPNISTLADGDS